MQKCLTELETIFLKLLLQLKIVFKQITPAELHFSDNFLQNLKKLG